MWMFFLCSFDSSLFSYVALACVFPFITLLSFHLPLSIVSRLCSFLPFFFFNVALKHSIPCRYMFWLMWEIILLVSILWCKRIVCKRIAKGFALHPCIMLECKWFLCEKWIPNPPYFWFSFPEVEKKTTQEHSNIVFKVHFHYCSFPTCDFFFHNVLTLFSFHCYPSSFKTPMPTIFSDKTISVRDEQV